MLACWKRLLGVVDRQAANLSELSRQSIVIDPKAAVHQLVLEVCESSLQQRPAGTHCLALHESTTRQTKWLWARDLGCLP